MAATGAASILITDTDSGARARVSDSFHGHDTQTPPNIEIPAAADPRLARAAQHRKTLFGALPEKTRLALLREAMPDRLAEPSAGERTMSVAGTQRLKNRYNKSNNSKKTNQKNKKK